MDLLNKKVIAVFGTLSIAGILVLSGHSQAPKVEPVENTPVTAIERIADTVSGIGQLAGQDQDGLDKISDRLRTEMQADPVAFDKYLHQRDWLGEPLIDSFFLIRMAAKNGIDPVESLLPLLDADPDPSVKIDPHGIDANDRLTMLQTKALQELQKQPLEPLAGLGMLEDAVLRIAQESGDLALVREAFRLSLKLTNDPVGRYDHLIQSRDAGELFALKDLRKTD